MRRVSILRRIATALITHAAAGLPQSRAEWGMAMKHECDHLESDFEALIWACGCVFASYRERSRDRSQSFASIVKQPSAFLPIAMSLTALAVVLFTLAIFGVPHGSDEGVAAHIWQLLIGGQMPLLVFFSVKWLPRAPRETLRVILLQIGAVVAAMAPVFLLHL